MSDENTNELYMPLSSTIVQKGREVMLYILLDLQNDLTIGALVDSRDYVSARAQTQMGRIRQQTRNIILKVDDPPFLQIRVASGA